MTASRCAPGIIMGVPGVVMGVPVVMGMPALMGVPGVMGMPRIIIGEPGFIIGIPIGIRIGGRGIIGIRVGTFRGPAARASTAEVARTPRIAKDAERRR